MINLKKITIILLIFSLMIILSGCWSSQEFDSLALIKGVGIDLAKKKDRIKFTVQISNPQEQQGGGQSGKSSSQTWTISSTGYTIFEANRNLIKTIGGKPFYPHSEVIIIGEELARNGIEPYIDILNRDPEFRRRTHILIAKGEAEKILETPHGLETISATGVKRIVNGQSQTGTIFANDLREFTISLLSDTKSPVTAPIELRQGRPQGIQKEKKKEKLIYAEGGAMFKGDKLVGWLTRKEARGLNWVLKPSQIVGAILVKSPKEKKRITIEVIKANSSLEPKFRNGKFKMQVKIKTKGNISESLVRKYDITKESSINQLDKRFAQVIKNEIISVLKKSQKYQTDIFGFGEAFRKKYPKQFKKKKDKWDQIYATLPVKIKVNASIKRFGMIEKGTATYK